MRATARVFWTLILGATALRLLLLAVTPIELLADEAHYWEWSRHPDLSYTTKGPGVAWLIWLGTTVVGDTAFGVRLLSPLLGGLAAWALGDLARRMTGSYQAAIWTVVLYLATLPFSFLHVVLTIDSPLFACWAVALNLGHRVLAPAGASLGTWALLGLVLAFGFVAKYAILLFVPGFLWHLIATRKQASRSRMPGLVVGTLCLLLGFVPVILWNAWNDWPTLTHLLGHLHVEGGDRPSKPWKPASSISDFLGWQLALLGPVLWLLWRGRHGAENTEAVDRKWLHRIAWPTLLFYGAVAIKTKVQANWTLPAYPSLLVATALWLSSMCLPETLRLRDAFRGTRIVLRIQIGLAVFAVAALFILPSLATSVESLRSLRPVARLSGHADGAAKLQAARDRVTAELGQPPFLITQRYTAASVMAFYLPDNPRVFCAQRAFGGRKTAYEYFDDTDLRLPELHGRPALVMGADLERWSRVVNGPAPEPIPGSEGIWLVRSWSGLSEEALQWLD